MVGIFQPLIAPSLVQPTSVAIRLIHADGDEAFNDGTDVLDPQLAALDPNASILEKSFGPFFVDRSRKQGAAWYPADKPLEALTRFNGYPHQTL